MTEKYKPQMWGGTVTFTDEEKRAMLVLDIQAAFDRTQKEMNRTLYGSAWDIKPTKPKSWLSRQVKTIRYALADRIASFASFVGGYDVRGDW